MKYTIKIDSSVGDQIAEQVLLSDYQDLCRYIKQLQEKTQLHPHEQEDLKNDVEVRDAMEKVLDYYVHDWKSKLENPSGD